ncbi:MAG TPA: class I SAM-dependent methyltransferase [Candidatus Nanoarchaeia archaeon]|nr:class I SAM-dependent methyltransferase [Candidatus Nanoarchaeia archaeon]
MTAETKKWWESSSKDYQEECKIPIDIHYGPGSPNESYYKLLGNLKGKKILEIGCGGAQCGVAMAKQGAKVIGIDISEEQLKFAKELSKKNKVNIQFYQGDIKKLSQIKSNSQDIVFTAFALHYVADLHSCFKEVYRVLKKNGLFVLSLGHPMYGRINSKTLRVEDSYFNIGKGTFIFSDPTKKFVYYRRNIGELHNTLVDAGFFVERIIEPDSRKRYSYDPWYGLWDYTPELMKMVPATIIFKARKKI